MRSSVIWSFLSLVALATGGLLSGCDSDAKIAKSTKGESCDSSADCEEGLRCLQGACYQTSPTPTPGGAGEGNGTGGSLTGPPAPVLGSEGESCTKRADCEDDLGCFNQRCTKEASGDGGGNGGPTLGGPGETCGLTSDCAADLKCLPANVYTSNQNSVGVCTPLDTDLKPSGMTCGHECVLPADCCELPVAQHAILGAFSCSDLAELVASVDCATAIGVPGQRCLAYASYCDDQCGAKTWACTAGLCQYAAKCTKPTEVVGGCPAYTRGGHPISPCDVKTSKCTPAVQDVVGCKTDAQCATDVMTIADDLNGDTCSENECACHKESGGCYRKCSEPTDCIAGFTCSDDTSLCVPIGGCTTDIQCVVGYRDPRATCVAGTCVAPPCEHDVDCNFGGLHNGSFTAVCEAGACVSLVGQCESSDECPPYAGTLVAGGVHSFCDTPAVPETTVLPRSAITD